MAPAMASPPASSDIHAAFQAAVVAHREGRLGPARSGYEAVLRLDARHADALHLLGLVHQQQGELAEAQRLIRQALAIGERPAFWANLGNVLRDMGSQAEAQAAYGRALALQPGFAEVWNNLAMMQAAAGQGAQAEASYRRALAIKPDYAAASYNLALLLAAGGRAGEAEEHYRRAIAAHPGFAEAHHNLGLLLQAAQRVEEAEDQYRRALALQPGFVAALHALGSLLHDTGRYEQAVQAHRQALALDASHARAHTDLGLALHRLGRADEALACYERALALEPGLAVAHYNAGAVLDERGQWDAAEAAYRRAISHDPGLPMARYNLGILLLRQQRFAEGWRQYEARHDPAMKPAVVDHPRLSIPPWRGESLQGRSLVVWPEQGLGDCIQFARYAPLLKARGVTRLTFVADAPLAALLASADGVDEVVTDPRQLRHHDGWCFALSLPLAAGEPDGVPPAQAGPYLHALPGRVARWRGRLPAGRPRVGLVWRGSALHKNDANRSLPLASLAPLWAVPGLAFVSLQKGQGEQEAAAPPPGQPLVALGADMDDFADAAAIVSELDLVICVDTAIAHLAGALGKPCWVLLPSVKTDWRWGLEGEQSLWYPSLRLFRQAGAGWDETLARVAHALRGWAAQAAATTSPTS